jgi:nitroimidazol reductase NimA-like FMN-containing flavoprotein (pyridoxamine 5'-phosphate oxidase superfamily)
MSEKQFPKTERSRPRRLPERGSHDREDVYAILDEGLVCHVGLVHEGQPLVIPMAYGRDGDRLFLHGATASRLLTSAAGSEVCVTVTLLDGVVLARSTFHSSFNYRSVVAFGRARRVEGEAERRAALRTIVEHIAPGRGAETRNSTNAELGATEVVEIFIDEASAKSRSGPPKDLASDVDAPVWAGVIPLRLTAGAPIPAPDLDAANAASEVVTRWHRGAAEPS